MLQCPTCDSLFESDDGMTMCPSDGAALLPVDAESGDDEDGPDDSFVGLTLEGGINLVDVAGEGAMGTVYEGYQTQMERRVAVKMLHGELAREPGFLERFMREARAIARLNHPNIVTVHSIGELSGSPYLVMEFIDGDTVSAAIRAGPLHPMRAIRIARQISSALADAHNAGIIHRDLKPSNVILTQRRRAKDFVKLLDFGVAKLVDADSNLTREGFVFGTPAYLSPEQANGVPIDARSDLYSLGVCLFEMLSATLPFTGNQVQMLLAHARDPAPPMRERAPTVPMELAALVDSLLEKDPNKRPASAEAVADMLDEMLGGDSPSPWASSALPSSEWTAVDLPAASAHQDSAATRELESAGRVAAMRAEDEAARSIEPSRRPPVLLALAGLVLLAAGAGTAALTLGKVNSFPVGVDFRPHIAITLPPAREQLPPGVEVKLDVPREALMFSQDGSTVRISLPTVLEVGAYYELSIDIWDEDGEPIKAENITTVFEQPYGELPVFAAPTDDVGRFALQRRFDDPGSYVMKVYPPQLDAPIEVHFEVSGIESPAPPLN